MKNQNRVFWVLGWLASWLAGRIPAGCRLAWLDRMASEDDIDDDVGSVEKCWTCLIKTIMKSGI